MIALIYTFAQKFEAITKTLMLFVTAPVFLSFIFKINNWPYSYELSLIMIVPMVSYLILVARKSNLKNEIGFLTIIAIEAGIEFSMIVAHWLS